MESNEITSRRLVFLAVILSLTAYILYSWKIFTGQAHPNISSWAVWSFLTIINTGSYKKLTGNWMTSILPAANTFMTVLIFFFTLVTGSLRALSYIDQICFVIGIIAGLLWLIKKSTSSAQILIQIAIVIGFIPTVSNAYHSPTTELWYAWGLWTISFVAQFFAVKYVWKGKYIEFLYPVNMVLWHAIVLGLAIR